MKKKGQDAKVDDEIRISDQETPKRQREKEKQQEEAILPRNY